MKKFDIGTIQQILELFMYKLNPQSFASNINKFPTYVDNKLVGATDLKWKVKPPYESASGNYKNLPMETIIDDHVIRDLEDI